MANFLPRSIILTMVVSFAISFAVMYWQRNPQEHSAPRVEATPSIAVSSPAAVPVGPPIAAPVAPALEAAARAGVAAKTAAASEERSPEEATASEALPVAFHIRNRRDLHVIDGDIRNITSKPMSITLRSVNPSTQATSEMHFELAPGERKTYSTENGLAMQPDDQLIVQSPPYQDRIVRVP